MSAPGRASTDAGREDEPLLGENSSPADRPRTFTGRVRRHLGEVFSPLQNPDSLRPLEKFLLVGSLILFLLVAVFIGLFAGAKHRLDHPVGQPISSPGGGSQDGHEVACTTPACVRTAASIIEAIDTSVDPCEDFYEFSTGRWRENHPIPADAGLFGMAQFITNENAKIVQKIMTDAPTDEPEKLLLHSYTTKKHDNGTSPAEAADRRNLLKLREYYDSCMDLATQNKVGNKPLLDLVLELHKRFSGRPSKGADDEDEVEGSLFSFQHTVIGSPVPPNRPPGRSPKPHPPTEDPSPMPPQGGRQAGFTQALAWAHTRGIDAFFGWMVDGEPVKDPSWGTATLLPGGLGFPDKAYYEDSDELKFYEDVVGQALVALVDEERSLSAEKHKKKKKGKGDKGKPPAHPPLPSEKELRALAKRVVEFEADLAKITPDGEELTDPLAAYNPTSLANLSYQLTAVDWAAYFKVLETKAPSHLIVNSPSFVKNLDSLISRTRSDVLQAYLVWSAVRDLGLHLGPDTTLRKPADRLDRRVKGVDPTAAEDRITICQGRLNEALGFLAGRYFVREAFSPAAKSQFERIVNGIITAFKSRLPELDWLDDKTRAFAEKKADAVRVKIGYPETTPETTDAVAMEKWYSDLDVKRSDWFGNKLKSQMRGVRRDWISEGAKLDAGRWDMFPAEVNAYYNPGGNEIVFPAGILQPMYYSELWPEYLQYGVGGSVAGHELSHAFDPDGRLYDEKGRLFDWWTPEVAKAFNERRDCLIDQYSNYTISDGKGGVYHLRGRFTIGEDVADAGGLAQSFKAWKDSVEQAGKDKAAAANPLLPGLEYSREQLFFIAYGLGWARSIRTGELIRRLRTDPHSPTMYRVIGALRNDDNFQAAFGCKPGQGMYRPPKEQCKIW